MNASAHKPGPLDLLILQPHAVLQHRLLLLLPAESPIHEAHDPGRPRPHFRRGVRQRDRALTVHLSSWHAGEPLVLPPAFYADAIAILERHNVAGENVMHSFQTNATLLDDSWCDFIQARGLRIGVSVDGPAFLHDRIRKTRSGEGTLVRVLEGMRRLRERGIPFHVISVLTRASLDYPDELFDFYRAEGIRRVGFNALRRSRPKPSSTIANTAGYRTGPFSRPFYDADQRAAAPLQVLPVRKIRTQRRPALSCRRAAASRSSEDAAGHPECRLRRELQHLLAGTAGPLQRPLWHLHAREHHDRFAHRRDGIAAACNEYRLTLPRGVERTGRPAPLIAAARREQEYFENGSFDSTETMYCRLSCQTIIDVVLDELGNDQLWCPHARTERKRASCDPQARHSPRQRGAFSSGAAVGGACARQFGGGDRGGPGVAARRLACANGRGTDAVDHGCRRPGRIAGII